MRELPLEISDERRLKSMTGLGYDKYDKLLLAFTKVYEYQRAEAKKGKVRKRKEGGGRKNSLPTIELKMLFVLYYLKSYPTFDVLGDRFGMKTSTANTQLHQLAPVLYTALDNMGVMPKRSYDSPKEFKEHMKSLGGMDKILLDATEREHFRYKDKNKRNAMFSGKKKSLL